MEAVKKVEDEKKDLEIQLTQEKDREKILLEQKDEQIAYYKDLKTKMSTKMVGETLEQHCEIQFNQLRATAFRNAYFEKDNDARTGSKGDYIYRETDANGVEIISIMFEMKNEMDETATKHKNEDFYKELEKDRREKNCEYAVLVSMLESDSELFNAGIVDVSYKYDKMYVVRPQCFIPIITLLRNAAMNALSYKQELAVVRSQNIDISNFEENLMNFKDNFGRNYDIAHTHLTRQLMRLTRRSIICRKSSGNCRGLTTSFGSPTIRWTTSASRSLPRTTRPCRQCLRRLRREKKNSRNMKGHHAYVLAYEQFVVPGRGWAVCPVSLR